MKDAGKKETPRKKMPTHVGLKAFIKQTYGDTWNGQASTWWLRNASFLRLKSVELGYTLPKDLTAKVGIQKHEFMSTEQTYLRLTTIRLLIRKQV